METVRYHAAGGLLVRGDQVLLLYKKTRGETVLPKGHVEDGETLAEAALRETREETGYTSLRLLANLGTERAHFQLNHKQVIRDETYFLMELLGDERDEAQTHDDADLDRRIFELRWTPLELAAAKLTFEPAKTFARRAVEWLAKKSPKSQVHSRESNT